MSVNIDVEIESTPTGYEVRSGDKVIWSGIDGWEAYEVASAIERYNLLQLGDDIDTGYKPGDLIEISSAWMGDGIGVFAKCGHCYQDIDGPVATFYSEEACEDFINRVSAV